jgi:hypothetical protein
VRDDVFSVALSEFIDRLIERLEFEFLRRSSRDIIVIDAERKLCRLIDADARCGEAQKGGLTVRAERSFALRREATLSVSR